MSGIYNFENFPEVYLELSGNIIDDVTVNEIINTWLSIFNLKKDFSVFINTENLVSANYKYVIYIANAIKKIKKNTELRKYIEKTTIYLYDRYIYTLFKSIFLLVDPISDVDIIFINKHGDDKIEHIIPKN